MRGSLMRRNFPDTPAFWQSPFRAMERFLDDDFFAMDRFMRPFTEEEHWLPAIDVREEDDEFVVSADLPGLSKNEVEVTVEDNRLTISGERKWEDEEKKDRYHRIERAYGKFCRMLTLPTAVLADKVKATFKDGILNVSVPKAEAVKPRKIDVH